MSDLFSRLPRTRFGPLTSAMNALSPPRTDGGRAPWHAGRSGGTHLGAAPRIAIPTLVLAHRNDLIHPFNDAVSLVGRMLNASLVRAVADRAPSRTENGDQRDPGIPPFEDRRRATSSTAPPTARTRQASSPECSRCRRLPLTRSKTASPGRSVSASEVHDVLHRKDYAPSGEGGPSASEREATCQVDVGHAVGVS